MWNFFSKWSLELLGHISCKYAHQCGLSSTSSLNELLQMWVTCRPTKALMEIATECFAAMYVLLSILQHILFVLSSCVFWKYKLLKIISKPIQYCIINDYFLIKRVGSAPDVCVDALLEASVKYSPHFDWVVAHIG